MEKLDAILEDLRPDLDFDKVDNLVDGNVFDSFDVITLVARINEEYDIDIDVNDVVPDNFNSKECMLRLIQKYR